MHPTTKFDSIDWRDFFLQDTKKFDLQYGGAYFIGDPYQRGYGIGNVFRSLYRFLLPIGKAIGREGVDFGTRFLDDVARGQNPKEALVRQGAQSLLNVVKKKSQEGSGQKRKTVKRKQIAGKQYKRKKIQDLFSPYNV